MDVISAVFSLATVTNTHNLIRKLERSGDGKSLQYTRALLIQMKNVETMVVDKHKLSIGRPEVQEEQTAEWRLKVLYRKIPGLIPWELAGSAGPR